MLQMEEMNFLQYMLLPAEWHCPLSDYFMRMVQAGAGRAYRLCADGAPVSYAVVLREGVGWRMPYLFTHPEQRRKGYARQMIRQLAEQLDGYLRAHIIQTHPYYDAMMACLQSLGFVVNDASCVYSVEVDGRFWARMEELNLVRVKEFLLRGGLTCMPLCATLEAMRKDPQIHKMKLTISDGNQRSYQFVMEILKGLSIEETRNVSLAVTAAMLKQTGGEMKR